MGQHINNEIIRLIITLGTSSYDCCRWYSFGTIWLETKDRNLDLTGWFILQLRPTLLLTVTHGIVCKNCINIILVQVRNVNQMIKIFSTDHSLVLVRNL